MSSQTLFKRHFQYPPISSSEAHGRVNLIGEHTDYNKGFVLPTLIEQKIEVSLSPRLDSKIVVYLKNLVKKLYYLTQILMELG